MAVNKIIYGNNTLIDLTGDTVNASNLLAGNTAHDRSGAIITGECTFDSDTSDADVSAAEILATKTAYANGNKITGSMPNNGAVTLEIDDKEDEITIPAGYHDGSGKAKIDATEKAKIVAGNIKSGVSILGVTGTYEGEAGTGQTKNVTPYTTAQTILPDSGYDYLAQVNVAAISYVVTPNSYGDTVTIGAIAPTV